MFTHQPVSEDDGYIWEDELRFAPIHSANARGVERRGDEVIENLELSSLHSLRTVSEEHLITHTSEIPLVVENTTAT